MDLSNQFESRDSSAAPDDLVLSEERLSVTTIRVPSGRARLERFLVTETQTFTVEVTHEEVRLTREPVEPAGLEPRSREDSSGKNIARWMPLHREEVVITKRVVPVERVRLEVYPVTEQRQITERIRKERLDTPDPAGQDS